MFDIPRIYKIFNYIFICNSNKKHSFCYSFIVIGKMIKYILFERYYNLDGKSFFLLGLGPCILPLYANHIISKRLRYIVCVPFA